jgi:hypothetical protein
VAIAIAPAAIPGPSAADRPFEIGNELTVYEAAMVYAGRHPYPHFFQVRNGAIGEHVDFLRLGLSRMPSRDRARVQRSWDIYCELARRIDQNQILPVRRAYDLQGGIDPRNTLIRTADLVDLANQRGERPRYLRHLVGRGVAERRKVRGRQTRDRAATALTELYPNGIPNQSVEPNAILCKKVGRWLKGKGQPTLSDATILRAASRRN